MGIFFFLTVILLVILPTIIFLRNLAKKNNQEELPLPPGRTGWPFFGETLDYFSKFQGGILEKFVMERREKYSTTVFRTSLIGEPMAIFSTAEAHKVLFSNENKLVRVWHPYSIEKIFPKAEDFGKRSANDSKVVHSFLKAEALKKYVHTMDMVMKQQLGTYWVGQEQVKAYTLVKRYTLTLACRFFLSMTDPVKVEQLGKTLQIIENGLFSLPISLPGTALHSALKGSEAVHKQITEIVKQRKRDLLESGASSQQDILSTMLHTTDENGQFLTEKDIAGYLFGLLVGGYGTTTSTITFIMKYLAELPHVYQEVLREQTMITKSKEPKELLNWDDTKKMRYTLNVFYEVMRMMPPGVGAFREAITDFSFDGYKIPKGWKLHWITPASNKNPAYFPDPEKFDPSRFDRNEVAPFTFIPFGGGPRMCPGNEYARLAVFVFMRNIVSTFRWEMVNPSEKVVTAPLPTMAEGLPVYLYPQNSDAGS
ncbi:hypothetical protein RJ640_007694 [Escallonia rubra]|uniref:Cytochrome P450 n=1 Tax=Escallonia rubra TaxID=112253 RepID=A0AA88RSE5_9ASTE|nr:hypothetical protein RJ640_007694 [Escallonia rubra]